MEHKIQEKATEIIGHNKEKAVELLGQTKEQAIDLIETKTSLLKKIFLVMLAIAIVVIGIWFFYEYKKGVIRDVDSFKDFINSFGIFGPLLLTIFQCVKTVYAVIPSTLGCIAGPALFGPWTGIICNYIGICSGSFLAFALSRKFGITLVKQIFSEKQYQRGLKKMEKWKNSYPVFLWVAIFLPISPDDFLCYFTGLTEMKFKKFALIILTSKPFTIIVYGLIFGNLFN
ncbi:TVP38/TMEM64 family protein [Treponema sp.]|uniref:TVP38/TMEM64 family protein n=1 Tax=Treponema sp. TaxID=166 RepID=UPI0025E0A00C|nr:TVP38/TMEM64 family protein [Treponema sp.]MBQ7538491.1 TVP38/TMEM64 family protein [Treponema sp.]MBR4322643.1 TVP38/TMEM64 family protein [Treponema sp.]MBR4599384.1 TVP38/TMEM64 family protein [Treponema sp.]